MSLAAMRAAARPWSSLTDGLIRAATSVGKSRSSSSRAMTRVRTERSSVTAPIRSRLNVAMPHRRGG